MQSCISIEELMLCFFRNKNNNYTFYLPLNAKRNCQKYKPVWAMRKCTVSMATHNRFKNGGVPAKLLISQLLLILDCLASYHIKV